MSKLLSNLVTILSLALTTGTCGFCLGKYLSNPVNTHRETKRVVVETVIEDTESSPVTDDREFLDVFISERLFKAVKSIVKGIKDTIKEIQE